MVERSKLTHFEEESKTMRTPQQRAEFYGAKNYAVGENVLMTPYNTDITNKENKVFNTRTYDGLAESIVSGWVHSPGHFKNIITPEYQVTGVTVAVDPETQKLYSCQKFATVAYKFTFEEPKDFFSYSGYIPEKPVTDFSGSKGKLLDHQHEWKVRHDNLSKCEDCNALVSDPPFITLRVERNSFILRVDNSEYVKKLIRDKKDGFAVEIVMFEDYVCGNPAYYTKPSRRNGECMLNGKILEPLYRDALFKGYKKRKRIKDVKLLSYILKADSVSFFKRFSQYKTARFTSDYFEISLGKVPKNLSGMWAHNLVYLQEKQICHVDYFTNYCGELFNDSVVAGVIPPQGKDVYNFASGSKTLGFEIPFERGKSVFSTEDIRPFTQSLSEVSYVIDSIYIKAFSSVEGDSVVNLKLQAERAQSIAGILKKGQSANIPVRIETATDWEHFYAHAKKSPQLSALAKMKQQEINAYIAKNPSALLETVLQKERRAEIKLYCTIPVKDENLKYLISKEYKQLSDQVAKAAASEKPALLSQISALYSFTYAKVRENKLQPAFLSDLKMPLDYTASPELLQQFVLYGFVYPETFAKNKEWQTSRDANRKKLSLDPQAELSPEYRYNEYRIQTAALLKRKTETQENIQELLNELEGLNAFYGSGTEASLNIDKLAFSINMLLLNHTYASQPMAKADDAAQSIQQLVHFYDKNSLLNSRMALKLARMAVFYNDIPTALDILTPFMQEDSVMEYAIPLAFVHPSEPFSEPYFDQLIALKATVNPEVWCNFFLNDCQIPFQVFDHEKLRNLFCEDCMGRNKTLKKL